MLLTIDAGNTNLTYAAFDGERLHAGWRQQTDIKRTVDETAAFLLQMFALHKIDPDTIDRVIIASVVPGATPILLATLPLLTRARIAVIGQDIKVEDLMEVKLSIPEHAGADRLLNGLAVRKVMNCAPAIVVDFGTATTFDVVDRSGAFVGGVIAPGLNLAYEALRQASALLPRVSLKKPAAAIGKNTLEAMQSGMYWGYISLIEGMISRLKAELDGDVTVIGTGGLAVVLAEDCPALDRVEPELTLLGLRWVAEQAM